MSRQVSHGSSGAPQGGKGASLGKKIATKTPAKISTNQTYTTSTNNNDSPEAAAQSKEQRKQEYNTALEKYQNEDPGLAFMKEENFTNLNSEETKAQSITELNAYMAGADSLAARVAAATGRYNPSANGFGSGRSRLPGDDPVSGEAPLPDHLPRNALTKSLLYRGIDPNEEARNNPLAGTTYTSRVNVTNQGVTGSLNGTVNNKALNFEAFTSAYLKENAKHLSNLFEGDEKYKAKYLSNLEKLYNSIDVRTLGQAPIEEKRSRLIGEAGTATARDRLQVANAFMTLLANSDQTLNKIAKSGLTVFMADSIVSAGEKVAGYFSTENHMVLSRNPGFASFNATAVHELTHVIDFNDGSLDGHINGLSPNWSGLRTDALDKIASSRGNLPGLESGFANYAQTNDMEFLSVMSQLYQSDTKDLQKNFPQIFSALDRMFRVA